MKLIGKMTREEMWEEFESQLKCEVRTPITMSYEESIRLAEMGIRDVVAKWKERLEQESCDRERGEWIEEKNGYRCNKCNHFYEGEWSVKNNAMIPHKYCPNCGKEMVNKSCSTCKHDGELVCTTHGCHNKERYEAKS